MKQLYLKPREGEPPILALRDIPQPGEPLPPDLVPLAGAVIEATSRFDKDSSWRACAKIAELCNAGVRAEDYLASMDDNVASATAVLTDLLHYVKGETELTEASATSLVAYALSAMVAIHDMLAKTLDQAPQPEPEPQQPEEPGNGQEAQA